jgi:hemolysin III
MFFFPFCWALASAVLRTDEEESKVAGALVPGAMLHLVQKTQRTLPSLSEPAIGKGESGYTADTASGNWGRWQDEFHTEKPCSDALRLSGGSSERTRLKMQETQPLVSDPQLRDGSTPLTERLQWYPPPNRPYSRRELLVDRVVNVMGVAAGCVGAVGILARSLAMRDTRLTFLSLVVYCVGIITMFVCSAVFHRYTWDHSRHRVLVLLDYLGISFLIAGSYTPPMVRCACWKSLLFVWGLALGGGVQDAVYLTDDREPAKWYSWMLCARYLLGGWSIMFVLPTVLKTLPIGWFRLSLAGGILYSLGVPVFLSKIEFSSPLWHVFVLAGSACIYLANFLHIAGVPI